MRCTLVLFSPPTAGSSQTQSTIDTVGDDDTMWGSCSIVSYCNRRLKCQPLWMPILSYSSALMWGSCKTQIHTFIDEFIESISAQFCYNSRACCSRSLQSLLFQITADLCVLSIHPSISFQAFTALKEAFGLLCVLIVGEPKDEGRWGIGNVRERLLVSIKSNILYSMCPQIKFKQQAHRLVFSFFHLCMDCGQTSEG